MHLSFLYKYSIKMGKLKMKIAVVGTGYIELANVILFAQHMK